MQRFMIALRILFLVAVTSALKVDVRRFRDGALEHCSDSRRLLISEDRVSEHFFGGRGQGSQDKPQDVRYNNVFATPTVDMVFTAVPSFLFLLAGLGGWDNEAGGRKSVSVSG